MQLPGMLVCVGQTKLKTEAHVKALNLESSSLFKHIQYVHTYADI